MKKEIWKDLNESLPFTGYQVSSEGRVRCFRDSHGNITDTYRILKPCINKDGYYEITLYTDDHQKKTKRVHKLVANAFLGCRPNLVVDHKDSNKLNNSAYNLQCVTPAMNSRLAKEAGLYKTKPIRIVETGEIFDSIKSCAIAINGRPEDIAHYFSGRYDSYKGFHFEFVDKKPDTKVKPFLYDHQRQAIDRMFTGCILNGSVGSGKSRCGLFYYFSQQGGWIDNGEYTPMKNPKDLYIVTTAMKRDKYEWDNELSHFLISTDPSLNYYKNKVVIDSWNNIKKYISVRDAFFIFDEDRVTGSGAWVRAFYKIAKANDWIILSATSGDCWMDYIPVFVANGFYRNRTEFINEHVVIKRYGNIPKIDRYLNTGRLIRLRNNILIDMDFEKPTTPHHEDVLVKYDVAEYKGILKQRWNPWKNEPILNASELCYCLRKAVNSDPSRIVSVMEIFEKHPRLIIFYNFDYELDILKNAYYGDNVELAEWNGHKHQPIPDSKRWIYLVQYTAGAEGWNSIKTDTILFYSQNYSYKVMTQAAGRIDRLNTPYKDLYYYHLKSRANIDLAISRALRDKKNFNEGRWSHGV